MPREPEMNETAARAEIFSLMREMEAEPIHVHHVAALAMQLFDQLAPLHGLDARARLVLEAAAHLHDIGHRNDPGDGDHHKESARLIREHPWKNFTAAEVEIMAQVARYHRKAMPDFTHEEFKILSEGERHRVQQLAAMLRLADSFDRAHQQRVSQVRVELRPNQICMHLEVNGPVWQEVNAARQKGDLAQVTFQRELVFLVGNQEIKSP
jgi:exopolyphosphatase/guanosine-5'-triphosphate,3'-diphosphate pyrophosphatase